MVLPLNPRQAWELAVRNAVERDDLIPLPDGSPPLSSVDRDLWSTHIRQSIRVAAPVTPVEWLAARAQRQAAPTSSELWAEVVALRSSPPGAS